MTFDDLTNMTEEERQALLDEGEWKRIEIPARSLAGMKGWETRRANTADLDPNCVDRETIVIE